jgi:Peptidase C39 family
MRTLPPIDPVRGGRHPATRRSPRAVALGTLLTAITAAGVLGAAAGDPGLPGRWAYRAVIRARGGAFISFPGAVLQSGFADCGPAALATLLVTLGGTPPPEDSIGSLAQTSARGTTFGGLARAARLLGVPSELRRLGPAAMDHLSSPVVAWVDRGHFVTVVPDSGDAVLVLDPEAGPYRIAVGRLRRYWSGEALVPRPPRASAGAAVSDVPTRRGGTT